MMKKFHNLNLKTIVKRSIRQFSSSLSGTSNPEYTRQMFELWSRDPSSVHETWNMYFSNSNQTTNGKINYINIIKTLSLLLKTL